MSSLQYGDLRAGALLIAPNTVLPDDWQLSRGTGAANWSRLLNEFTDRQLDSELGPKGWTFFFLAGAIRSSAYGWNTSANLTAALGRLLAETQRQRCNCLQIDSVSRCSLLGVPSIRMAAHVRHIQKGTVFSRQ